MPGSLCYTGLGVASGRSLTDSSPAVIVPILQISKLKLREVE